MVKNMNTKRYKDYVMEIRVTSDTCKKYNISGKSNDIARNLKQILHTSQLNRDECKDIMKWFEKIIREYAHTSCIFIPHAKPNSPACSGVISTTYSSPIGRSACTPKSGKTI